MKRENQSTRRKTSRSKDENQQQRKPTHDTESGNRKQATLVLAELSAIVSPLRKIQGCDHVRLTLCGHFWTTWVQFKYTFCQRKLLRASLKKQSTC